MASEMVRSSTYFQLLDVIGEWLIRSLTIIKNRMGSSLVHCGTPAVTAAQLEHRLRSTGQEATDPRDQRPAHNKNDQLHNDDVVIITIKRFAKIKEANAKVLPMQGYLHHLPYMD